MKNKLIFRSGRKKAGELRLNPYQKRGLNEVLSIADFGIIAPSIGRLVYPHLVAEIEEEELSEVRFVTLTPHPYFNEESYIIQLPTENQIDHLDERGEIVIQEDVKLFMVDEMENQGRWYLSIKKSSKGRTYNKTYKFNLYENQLLLPSEFQRVASRRNRTPSGLHLRC